MIALPGTPIILYHMVTYHKYRNTWRWKIGFSDTAFHHSHPFHHHPYYWHHQHHHDDHQSPSVITIKSIITIITNLQFFIQDGDLEDKAILYAAACDRCSSDCAHTIPGDKILIWMMIYRPMVWLTYSSSQPQIPARDDKWSPAPAGVLSWEIQFSFFQATEYKWIIISIIHAQPAAWAAHWRDSPGFLSTGPDQVQA